ncbi:hypothetical protein AMATHDRAFT_135417 [Amanita thiersii Skay4041]|uniref:Nitrogen permease regulator 2 n=1 Tax=Amanita thiersii Skay4041 TaxID=703135 RepID=A0A2A9NT75_9AGAR|nr:hypothetical protein AMATHDRAFT_135417 [Amanita thiersii Skay4041]
MPEGGDSFLPRIQSVFYAVFDVRQGPKIVYQVPEGLIAVPLAGPTWASGSIPPTPLSEAPPSDASSRSSCTSLVSPSDAFQPRRSLTSPQKRSPSATKTLFNFDEISKFVIPPPALCGRLVTCSTKQHRIIGFPIELKGKYQRNYFRYNLCFVFDRGADLSCYEPIVRKISRVLTTCEEESGFLSSPSTSHALYAILEQLYEDLNSYSETSIAIDQFNTIELKIFPFYPNPPPVEDWMVPLALINLTKRIEDNWDLTMVKVCQHINGVNHVSRIAHLADCDIALTRLAISHLLYYQVILTIDIFQFSNMYTLRKSIQWLANETHVRDECGPYVTRPGRKPMPDWPQLLHLYSRLRSGTTVFEWMQAHNVSKLGIDVRRFVSFGVIKGFLRRVHRWPVLLTPELPKAIVVPEVQVDPQGLITTEGIDHQRKRDSTQPVSGAPGPSELTSHPSATNITISATQRARRASAAERVLEQLRNKDIQRTTTSNVPPNTVGSLTWIHQSPEEEKPQSKAASMLASVAATTNTSTHGQHMSMGSTTPLAAPVRPRLSRSPSAPHLLPQQQTLASAAIQVGGLKHMYPQELIPLLDGDHHTDDLAVRFEAGWPLLEQWLIAIGGGTRNGDYGRVAIIYR